MFDTGNEVLNLPANLFGGCFRSVFKTISLNDPETNEENGWVSVQIFEFDFSD